MDISHKFAKICLLFIFFIVHPLDRCDSEKVFYYPYYHNLVCQKRFCMSQYEVCKSHLSGMDYVGKGEVLANTDFTNIRSNSDFFEHLLFLVLISFFLCKKKKKEMRLYLNMNICYQLGDFLEMCLHFEI